MKICGSASYKTMVIYEAMDMKRFLQLTRENFNDSMLEDKPHTVQDMVGHGEKVFVMKILSVSTSI